MTTREYECQLEYKKRRTWEPLGEPVGCRVDLDSLKSRLETLLFLMQQNRKYQSDIESCRMAISDQTGQEVQVFQPKPQELKDYNDGYPEGEIGTFAPTSLAVVSDDDLVAELQRRLGRRR